GSASGPTPRGRAAWPRPPAASPRRTARPDPVDHEVDDVRGQLIRGATSGPGLASDPRIDEVEHRLGRERRVHRPQLARPHAVIEDELQRREEVPEERAPRLAQLIGRELDPALAQEARRAALRADEIRRRRYEPLARGRRRPARGAQSAAVLLE